MMSTAAAIGVDIGGTQIKAVAVDGEGCVLGRRQADTSERAEVLLQGLNELLDQLPSSEALGISAPGLVPPGSASVAWMHGRLDCLEGLDWSKQLHRPAHLLNDALAAMAGEAWIGAARDVRDAILMTLGTGVGGAILVDGRVLRGCLGRAGHLGHMTVDALGSRDIVGTPGSLEDAIGNHTVKARSFGRFESTHDLVQAYLRGDPEASRVWLQSIWCLAAAIVSLVNIIDPRRVLIGGGICKAGDALFKPLAAYLEELEWRPTGQSVEIVPALLGHEAGAIGAARNAMLGGRA
jgi:glucokinase